MRYISRCGPDCNQRDMRVRWVRRVAVLVWVLVGVGSVEFGTLQYTEYIAGYVNSSIVLVTSHGGSQLPDDIPNRQDGCYDDASATCNWNHDCGAQDSDRCGASILKDLYTQEIARLLQAELSEVMGATPHLVVSHLHRRKLDPNREIGEGAQGNQLAEQVWQDFHSFIRTALDSLPGPGLLLDIHGQAHSEGWVELGYLVSGSQLDNDNWNPDDTSIRSLYTGLQDSHSFEWLLRGVGSLGQALAERGYTTVPSQVTPGPSGGNYFSGGYNTKQYGSRDGGSVDAIQLEAPSAVRNQDNAPEFVHAVAQAVKEFMVHYTIPMPTSAPVTTVTESAEWGETDNSDDAVTGQTTQLTDTGPTEDLQEHPTESEATSTAPLDTTNMETSTDGANSSPRSNCLHCAAWPLVLLHWVYFGT